MRLDVAQLAIPPDVDLTSRQILKLAIVAMRKTLEEYQRPQTQPLAVTLVIEGADEAQSQPARSRHPLRDRRAAGGKLNP